MIGRNPAVLEDPGAGSVIDRVGFRPLVLQLAMPTALDDGQRSPKKLLAAVVPRVLYAPHWHGRLCREVDVSLDEAQAVLAALVLLGGERKRNATYALAELLSRRGLERPCGLLVAWAGSALDGSLAPSSPSSPHSLRYPGED